MLRPAGQVSLAREKVEKETSVAGESLERGKRGRADPRAQIPQELLLQDSIHLTHC